MNTNSPPTARFALNLLLDDASRLLLLKRVDSAHLGPGLWGLPAGKIEAGETAAAAAAREMCEEIGPDHRVELTRYLGPIRDTYYGGQYEIHLFQQRWRGGEVVLNDEHTAWAWVAPEDFHRYPVMDGIEEDIALLGFWPQRYLDRERIPPHLREDAGKNRGQTTISPASTQDAGEAVSGNRGLSPIAGDGGEVP